MSSSPEFAAHCVELLSPLGPARAKRMFGGHGFYVDDVFVGIAISDRFYLKVDETSRGRFEAAGCEPFEYEGKDGRRVTLGFWWTAPDDALESPMLMLPWARMAMEASLKARNAKAPKRPAAKKAAARKPPAPTAAKKKVATKKSVSAKTTISPAPAPARATSGAAAKKKSPKPAPKR